MGLEEEGIMFQNQTFHPHVFRAKTSDPNHWASPEVELVFADFYFVTELSEEKGSEFCAVRVRFVLDGNGKWSPFMLSWAVSSFDTAVLNGIMF
jgi:hypothetical protein